MNAGGFSDHFSGVAGEYARHRPGYPRELAEWLAARVPARRRAWDCATGSGQAARLMADYVRLVVATDASEAQLATAARHPRVRYVCATAEAAPLADGSVELLTVAQALHWFDLPAFYAEAERVVTPGGLVAAWTYALPTVDGGPVDAAVRTFCDDVLAGFWPPERVHVDRAYRDLPFPFAELPAPTFTVDRSWTLADLVGFLGTWSATQAYRRDRAADPVAVIGPVLAAAWGAADAERRVRWAVTVRAGRR